VLTLDLFLAWLAFYIILPLFFYLTAEGVESKAYRRRAFKKFFIIPPNWPVKVLAQSDLPFQER
jgi:hypothetical protein